MCPASFLICHYPVPLITTVYLLTGITRWSRLEVLGTLWPVECPRLASSSTQPGTSLTPAGQLSCFCSRQCCGSGMFIPNPGSWFLPIPDPGSRISDPGSKNSSKREGWKKNLVVIPFYVATNFTKLKIILVLKWWRKKFGPILKEL